MVLKPPKTEKLEEFRRKLFNFKSNNQDCAQDCRQMGEGYFVENGIENFVYRPAAMTYDSLMMYFNFTAQIIHDNLTLLNDTSSMYPYYIDNEYDGTLLLSVATLFLFMHCKIFSDVFGDTMYLDIYGNAMRTFSILSSDSVNGTLGVWPVGEIRIFAANDQPGYYV